MIAVLGGQKIGVTGKKFLSSARDEIGIGYCFFRVTLSSSPLYISSQNDGGAKISTAYTSPCGVLSDGIGIKKKFNFFGHDFFLYGSSTTTHSSQVFVLFSSPL